MFENPLICFIFIYVNSVNWHQISTSSAEQTDCIYLFPPPPSDEHANSYSYVVQGEGRGGGVGIAVIDGTSLLVFVPLKAERNKYIYWLNSPKLALQDNTFLVGNNFILLSNTAS